MTEPGICIFCPMDRPRRRNATWMMQLTSVIQQAKAVRWLVQATSELPR